MSTLQLPRPLLSMRPLSLALLVAMVPACHHGSSSSGTGGPPVITELLITNLVVEPGPNFAKITWDTNTEADGRVDYGLSPQYSDGATDPAQAINHTVVLTGLQPETEYHFSATSMSLTGLTASTADDVFFTTEPNAILSDDFNRYNLNRGVWTYADPQNRGELKMKDAGSDDARVILTVPDNIDYRPENGSLRLEQTMRDISPVELETKLTNRFEVVGGQGGLFVESGTGNFANFGFRFDGTDLVLDASQYAANNLVMTQTSFVQAGAWNNDQPLWLRVNRNGDQYASSFSFDGMGWLNGPVTNLPGAPFKAGLYAANEPGFLGDLDVAADYIYDNAFPLPLEDHGVPDDNDAPYIYRYDVMALSDGSARVRWWSDEASAGVLRYGLTPALMGGVRFQGNPDWVNELVMTGLDPGSLYYLELTAADGRGQSEILSGLTVTTPGLGGGNPAARVWNGWEHPTLQVNYQTFGEQGNAQDRVNVVGRVYDTDENRVDLNDTLVWTLNDGPQNTAILGDPRSNTTNIAPWRLADEGDFNIVIPVMALGSAPIVDGYHRNELRIVVTDDDGNIGVKTVFVLWKPNTSWSRNYMTDFGRAALNTKNGHQFEVQVVDGDWFIDNSPELGFALRTNPKRVGYDRLFAIGEALSNQPWDNYEAVIPFTAMGLDLQGFTPGTGSYAFGVVNRWNGHQNGGPFAEPKHGLYPLSSLFTYRWFDLNGSESWELWVDQNQEIQSFAGPAITLGTSYVMKMRVQSQGDGSTTHSFKVWPLSEAEPAAFTFERNTPAGSGPDTGSLAIFAHHVDILFGDISVTGL